MVSEEASNESLVDSVWAGTVVVVMILRDVRVEALVRVLQAIILSSYYRTEKFPSVDVYRPRTWWIEKEKGGMTVAG